MKYYFKFIIVWVIACMTLMFHSCDYLNVDDYFNETFKYDSLFTSRQNLERYLWATAASFPDEGNMLNTLGSFACDEAFSITDYYVGMSYTQGNITPTNLGVLEIWSSMYIIIRKANTILANIDNVPNMTTLDKREILGYVYFMRAYAYYKLLMQYGPIVILGDDVLETNEEMAYYDRARETFDVSVDYICTEFEQAAAYLPTSVAFSFFGRPTRGSALGLCARLRLIQASPLWNGEAIARRTYGSWKRSTDDAHYVSQTPDERKWAVAAMACKRIIDMNLYSLHTVQKMPDTNPLPDIVPDLPFPDGAGDIDPFRSYSDMFTGEALAVRNPEYLWARESAGLLNYSRHAFPVVNLNGWGAISVPQKIIDAFRMTDGRTIDDSSSEYPYSTEGTMGGTYKIFSGYRLNSQVSNMYVNREMRFYASIGFSEAFWPCNSTSNSAKRNQTLTYYAGGNAGKTSIGNYPDHYSISGYTLKKYVHEDDAWGDALYGTGHEGAKRTPKTYSIIRYAEILLSYVEALNNLTTSHTVQDTDGETYTLTRNTEEMKKYFNMVRFRAGLPGPTDEELSSPQTVQSLIERERMVEFLHENIRYFDVRRWGKYEITESEPFTGMDTDATSPEEYYIETSINHSKIRNRVIDRKLILCPLYLYEVRKSPSLDQNPGYQF